MRVTVSSGSCFFVGTCYLETTDPETLTAGMPLDAAILQDMLDAASAFAAERKALALLTRAEQCRSRLADKLRKKNHEPSAVERALDHLEQDGILSDDRYASAWLRNRMISRAEGRTRLYAELLSRGVSRAVAERALDGFFACCNEREQLERAVEKCRRIGKTPETTFRYLVRSGFPVSLIRKIVHAENVDKSPISKYADR